MKMYDWPNGTAPSPGYWWTWPTNQPDTNIQWNWWGTCPNCNRLYQWGNKFCPNCGHQLILEEDDAGVLEKIEQTLEALLKEVRGLSERAEGPSK